MKIIIIGHKGNLGQQLMKVFKNLNPVGLDREDIDITNEKTLSLKITELNPQIVINASAYNDVNKCEESEEEFELAKKINGYGPGYLAKICKKLGAVLVHYSTDYVFKGDKEEGYLESDIGGPIQNYGESKYLGEQEIKKGTERYFLIRTSKLFGPSGVSEFSKKSFIDIMLDLGRKKKSIEVVDEEVSCFTYTPDLAEATRKLLGFGKGNSISSRKWAFGNYHFVNENPCTWYECAVKLFKIAGEKVEVKPVPAEQFPRLAKRPAYSRLLNTKFPKLRNWEEAVKEYIDFRNK